MNTATQPAHITRDEAIARIKAALKARTGKTWSVKGGRGTAYGWINISVTPKQQTEFGSMPEAARVELAQALGFSNLEGVHHQGCSIPASQAYYREYVNRAELGHNGGVVAQPYWD